VDLLPDLLTANSEIVTKDRGRFYCSYEATRSFNLTIRTSCVWFSIIQAQESSSDKYHGARQMLNGGGGKYG
jgi:hypothetical protein